MLLFIIFSSLFFLLALDSLSPSPALKSFFVPSDPLCCSNASIKVKEKVEERVDPELQKADICGCVSLWHQKKRLIKTFVVLHAARLIYNLNQLYANSTILTKVTESVTLRVTWLQDTKKPKQNKAIHPLSMLLIVVPKWRALCWQRFLPYDGQKLFNVYLASESLLKAMQVHLKATSIHKAIQDALRWANGKAETK